MKVCSEYAIPHSEFLSWDADDRDKAIWFCVRKSETCPSCGTREAEWDPERGGHRHAYKPQIRRCPGCEMKSMIEDTEEAQTGRGIYITLTKVNHG